MKAKKIFQMLVMVALLVAQLYWVPQGAEAQMAIPPVDPVDALKSLVNAVAGKDVTIWTACWGPKQAQTTQQFEIKIAIPKDDLQLIEYLKNNDFIEIININGQRLYNKFYGPFGDNLTPPCLPVTTITSIMTAGGMALYGNGFKHKQPELAAATQDAFAWIKPEYALVIFLVFGIIGLVAMLNLLRNKKPQNA